MHRLQGIICIVALSLTLWTPCDGNPLHGWQRIGRSNSIDLANLLKKELPLICSELLVHLGRKGDTEPSICLPDSERNIMHWYRFSDAAGSRLCLYEKCLRRLENKYSCALNNTLEGLNKLARSIFKMKARDFVCGEAETPDPGFWMSMVIGGAYVIRDLIDDLNMLNRSDSLTIVS